MWHEEEDLCFVMFEQPGDADPDGGAAPSAASGADDTEAAAASDEDAAAAADSERAGPDAQAAAAADAGPLQSNGQPRGKTNKKRKNSPSKARKTFKRVRIDEFPVASELINSLMPLLRQELMANDVLRERLFSVAFHSTLSKQAMITQAYHKKVRGRAGQREWLTGLCL